jgi:lysophospholipase L1-like esterase
MSLIAANPIGMVHELEPTPRKHTPYEQAALEFVLSTGPTDPVLLARLRDPAALQAGIQAETEQRASDWPNIGQYRGANIASRAVGSPKVVFIGDSITEFWQYADTDLFSKGIIGRGISGQTTQQHLVRFYPDVVSLKPIAVHILGGGNDVAGNTGATTPQDYKNNIMAMLDIAQCNSIKVLLGGILPAVHFPWRPEVKPAQWYAMLNDWLRDIARERGAIFIDYYSVMAEEDRSMRADFTNDGVHPNVVGYAAMRPLVLSAIHQVLGSP